MRLPINEVGTRFARKLKLPLGVSVTDQRETETSRRGSLKKRGEIKEMGHKWYRSPFQNI